MNFKVWAAGRLPVIKMVQVGRQGHRNVRNREHHVSPFDRPGQGSTAMGQPLYFQERTSELIIKISMIVAMK